MADCLSRWAYLATKGMTDVSAHCNEAETAEAKKIIDMECLMEEEGVKCFVVMAADATYDFVGHSAAKTAFTLPHWI